MAVSTIKAEFQYKAEKSMEDGYVIRQLFMAK